jgi:Skp family chaperone for outer membrane proteins
MKIFFGLCSSVALALCPLVAADVSTPAKISIVSLRSCFEQSKEGHKTRDMLEGLTKQLGSVMDDFDKKIEEISHKLNDEDVRDSMTPEAEKELQEQYENLSQEREFKGKQLSQQFSQTQMMAMQQFFDKVSKASELTSKEDLGLGVILQEDSTLYYSPELDATHKIVLTMNRLFDEDQKNREANDPKAAETKEVSQSSTNNKK